MCSCIFLIAAGLVHWFGEHVRTFSVPGSVLKGRFLKYNEPGSQPGPGGAQCCL